MPPAISSDHDLVQTLVNDVRYIKKCLSGGTAVVTSIALAMFAASLHFWHEAEVSRETQVAKITETLTVISQEVKANSAAARGR